MLKTFLALGLFIGGVNAWSQSAFIGPTVPQGATVTVGAITALGTLTNNTSGTASAITGVTTPASGTLVGVTDTQTLTNKILAPTNTIQGDATGTPSVIQWVTSTNAGITAGIPVGNVCQITQIFSSGSNYLSSADCTTSATAGKQWYFSPAHVLNSPVWATNQVFNNTMFTSTTPGVFTNLKNGEVSQTSSTVAIPVTAQLVTVTLAANYSFTIVAGAAGQTECFQFIQPATGGPFTVTPPADVKGFFAGNVGLIGTTASGHNMQCFSYSTVDTAWAAQSGGVINF